MKYKSQVHPECVCEVSAQKLKISPQILYHFENDYFEWKQKHAIFMHVPLNANELLLPAPFSRIGLYLYSSYLRWPGGDIFGSHSFVVATTY